jgi:hypothetical protein
MRKLSTPQNAKPRAGAELLLGIVLSPVVGVKLLYETINVFDLQIVRQIMPQAPIDARRVTTTGSATAFPCASAANPASTRRTVSSRASMFWITSSESTSVPLRQNPALEV